VVPWLVLHPNRPNPFRGSTTFAFALARSSDVTVRVYDAAGRLVAEPVRRAFTAGPQEVTWDGTGRNGRRLASGRYVYEVIGGGERRTGRFVLLR
jgi:flagellar hook assembly protein FlgD